MKLSCPSCGAKYSIADEKVQDRLAKIRCRKCSATIIVDGKVNPPSVYTSDGGASPAAEAGDPGGGAGPGEYSVDFGDNDQRAMTADDIVQAYRRGEITEETFVWADGMSDWTAISQVPELADALAAAAPPAAAAAPRAAARSGAGRGSATDLFGGIATAGSEEDVMTSAPQPAMGAAPAPTGARNESSVLFSLSALTASAPAASPAKSSVTNGAGDSSDHDSGLIDLKALTSSVAQAPANPLALGTAPLGMASPLGGITAPAVFTDGPMPQAQSKTGMYMAVALVLVGALIAGAIVMVGSKEAPPAVPSSAAAPVEPAAAPAPVAEAKKEQPTAEPPATGTAATAEPPKEEGAKQASTTRSTPRSTGSASRAKAPSSTSEKSSSSGSSGSTSSGSSSTSEKSSSSGSSGTSDKPKKKKEKTCNCAPSDLMCAMKCAAG